jgi:membrane-associated phospholipid phosphatase
MNRMQVSFGCILLCLALGLFSQAARAGFDHYDDREDSGIFSRQNQKRLDALVIGGMIGTAVWEGTDYKLGRTSWQAIDSSLLTAGTTEVLKAVFQRPRPSQNPDPNDWFAGRGNKSFPSGETALMAAAVTPYIVAYKDEHPAVWGLTALPLYMGYARMASQGHWLSDVLAGAAVGTVMGYYASQRVQPLVLSVSGKGVFVGWRTKF